MLFSKHSARLTLPIRIEIQTSHPNLGNSQKLQSAVHDFKMLTRIWKLMSELRRVKNVGCVRSLLAVLAVFCTPASIIAHPFHVSSAEIEYNAETRKYEVSLRVQTADLELALARQTKRSIAFEKDVDTDRQIAVYLENVFYLSYSPNSKVLVQTANQNLPHKNSDPSPIEAKSKSSKLIWAGKENDGLWVWLYFELEPPTGTGELQLTNRVLFDCVDGQLNTCVVRHNQHTRSLSFNLACPQSVLKK